MDGIRHWIVPALWLAVAGPGLGGDLQTMRFHGIRPGDAEGRQGLPNPERGFRLEAVVADGKEPSWATTAEKERADGITLVQTYCYLQDCANVPIPPEKLAALQRSFDELHHRGMKSVLRFAYESRSGETTGPRLEDLLGHIRQLQPVIRSNVGLIHVLQAGMIGLWGEWHHSVHGLDKDTAAQKSVVAAWLEALPQERMLQVRRAAYKRITLGEDAETNAARAFDGSPASRIGFHHDFFVVRQNGWDTSPGTKDFDQVTRESPYVMVDGEMPWATDAGGDESIDGLAAAERLHLHHYSSFSFAHNNREYGLDHAIALWMRTPLTMEQLRERHLPVSDGYFDLSKDAAPRTVFEYIRDHLGYRLELQEASFPSRCPANGEFSVTIKLINRGFATLCNPRPVFLILIAEDGSVREFSMETDPRKWQPHPPGDPLCTPLTHLATARVKLSPPLAPGPYRVGLWLPDGSSLLRHEARYAVRCANRDAMWWTDTANRYGVNILGEVTVE